MERVTGRVAWYSESKGFGFITRVGGPDVFLHCSAVPKQVAERLRDGAEVEFEVSGPDGLHADRVALVEALVRE